VTREDVAKTVRDAFGINAESMAQFLAQDTVREFTNSSPRELLRGTYH
jgi:hypothetical protein